MNPDPVDGAFEVGLSVVLSWSAGTGAAFHDIYFGTNPTATYDPVTGDLIPAGQTLPDPLATDPVTLYYLEDPNNQPIPNVFFPTAGLSIQRERFLEKLTGRDRFPPEGPDQS